MLDGAHEAGLLKARGRQRTDSTHVLAAVRALNRLALLAEYERALDPPHLWASNIPQFCRRA
jgi:transposase